MAKHGVLWFFRQYHPEVQLKEVEDYDIRGYKTCPQQADEINCGIYCITGMEAFLKNEAYTCPKALKPANVRERLVYNLLLDNHASIWCNVPTGL